MLIKYLGGVDINLIILELDFAIKLIEVHFHINNTLISPGAKYESGRKANSVITFDWSLSPLLKVLDS